MASIYALRKLISMPDVLTILGPGWECHPPARIKFAEHEISAVFLFIEEKWMLAQYQITAGGRAELEDMMAEKLDAISEHDEDDPDWYRLFGEYMDDE